MIEGENIGKVVTLKRSIPNIYKPGETIDVTVLAFDLEDINVKLPDISEIFRLHSFTNIKGVVSLEIEDYIVALTIDTNPAINHPDLVRITGLYTRVASAEYRTDERRPNASDLNIVGNDFYAIYKLYGLFNRLGVSESSTLFMQWYTREEDVKFRQIKIYEGPLFMFKEERFAEVLKMITNES